MSSRNYALPGELREGAGKGVARALRRDNKIPAVIYGDGKPPVTVALNAKYVNLEYSKGHMLTSLCNLEVGNDKHLVLARDIQLHPVTDYVWHIDFLRVTPKTKLTIGIPVKFLNEAECPGIKDGGVLNVSCWDIELTCVATEIPDHIEVDLLTVNKGDAIRLADIKLPAGAKFTGDAEEFIIASVNEPRQYVEETPVAAPAEGEEGAEGAAAEGAEGAAAEGEKKAEGGGDKKAAEAKPAEGKKGK